MDIRKSHTSAFKVQVAFSAVKEEKTMAELTSQYGVHANQIRAWKNHLIENARLLFEKKENPKDKEMNVLIDELYRQIGQLKVELDWLKKKSGHTSKTKN